MISETTPRVADAAPPPSPAPLASAQGSGPMPSSTAPHRPAITIRLPIDRLTEAEARRRAIAARVAPIDRVLSPATLGLATGAIITTLLRAAAHAGCL